MEAHPIFRARRLPALDQRLRNALEMTPPCEWCADIGADHGRLSAHLLCEGRARHMLVSDVSAKALEKARALLTRIGLEKHAVFAVADGLSAFQSLPSGCVPDAACVLGLGGDTVAGILTTGEALLGRTSLVLGAQTELPVVRAALMQIGYRLAEERVVRETGRWYVLMRALPAHSGEKPYTDKELLLGPCLLTQRTDVIRAYWERRRMLLKAGVLAMTSAQNLKDAPRLERTQRELQYVEEAIASASK